MSIQALILLASLGPVKRVHVPQMGSQEVFFQAAPQSGDLIRNGLHPLAVILTDHRHKPSKIEKLFHGLGVGGFNRLAIPLPRPTANTHILVSSAIDWALKQPATDPKRVYIIGAEATAIGGIHAAIQRTESIRGLVWLSPVLNSGAESVLPLLSKLAPLPVVLTADVSDRSATSAVSTLRTVLKLRFPDVRRIRRAKLGRGTSQLEQSATLADQLIITLRTWAEKNCDRTAPKKKTLNEGCKK